MLGESHALNLEFPQYQALIDDLKQSLAGFAELTRQYNTLDHKIRSLELANIPTSDANFLKLKSERVALKDELYGILHSKAG
ncbi:MAG: YdcH family protein [Shewanella sp.]